MVRYLIHLRKSTRADDRQALSHQAQLAEVSRYARANGLVIAGIFRESESAKEPGRKVFNQMLQAIEQGKADGILCWAINRLARNFTDGTRLMDMLQKGVLKEIRTPSKRFLPTDNILMLAIEFGIASQYSRDLSVDVARSIRDKVRNGIFPGRAPLGYYNDRNTKTVEPDWPTFRKVRRLFELFATGNYTLTTLKAEADKLGLVGKNSKRPLTINSLNKLLRNPFFYGSFYHKGELHKGIHKPLIDKAIFDRIQKVRTLVGKPRKKRGDKGFTFLSFAKCESCGCSITAERHVKKSGRSYVYYRCTRKNRRFPCGVRRFMSQTKLAEQIRQQVERVSLSDAGKDRLLAKIEAWKTETGLLINQDRQVFDRELKLLNLRIYKLNDMLSREQITDGEFRQLKNPLVEQRAEIEGKLAHLELTGINWLELMREWVLEANRATKWVSENNFLEMRDFLKKIGSNLQLSGERLTVGCKKPWDLLAQTNLALRNSTGLAASNALWCGLANEVRTHFEKEMATLIPFPTAGNPSEVALAA